MAQITQDGQVYIVLDEIQLQYTELCKLIVETESMDFSEKQYWFDILPSMTDEQIDRLFDILETERRKLEELEIRFQEEIKTINEKQLIDWQNFQSKESKKKISDAESKANAQDGDADEILRLLNDV
jgi:hypothetical protein